MAGPQRSGGGQRDSGNVTKPVSNDPPPADPSAPTDPAPAPAVEPAFELKLRAGFVRVRALKSTLSGGMHYDAGTVLAIPKGELARKVKFGEVEPA